MVGRTAELQIISEKLDLTVSGQAQLIGIVAEAGMGKSRLAAEVIRLARRKGFAGYGGACQSDAINTPYQTWKSIWAHSSALTRTTAEKTNPFAGRRDRRPCA